jgi:hypothetical protein
LDPRPIADAFVHERSDQSVNRNVVNSAISAAR